MDEHDARFFAADVPLETLEETPCTPPVPGRGWTGVVIAAPRAVRLQRHWRLTSLPLCGRYLLPVRRRPFATLLEGLRVHVRDEATQEVRSGVLADGDTNLPDPEAKDLPDEQLKNLQVGGCFTSDLLAHVEVPVDEPARYTVWLELPGELTSNEVQVELIGP